MRLVHVIRSAFVVAWLCGGLPFASGAPFRVEVPKPYAGGPFPLPPSQSSPLKPATPEFPTNHFSAAEALFAAGFANPQGCVYTEISVAVGSLWSGDGGIIDTRGWLIPGTNSPRFAVCWNGLVYPVVRTTGKPADFRADIEATLGDGYRENGWVLREEDAVSHRSTHPLKGLVLLRLGEERMALDYWESLARRANPVKAAPAPKAAGPMRPIPGVAPARSAAPEPVKPAAPPKPALPKDAPDPFIGWATLWASSALDRALCAFMRGDDRFALHTALPLVEAAATLEKAASSRGASKPSNATRHFPFLEIVPRLVAETTRRTSRPAASAVRIEALLARTNRAERIAGLLARLPDLAPRQRSQSGGLNPWSEDPAIPALMGEGQAAVEPMLDFLMSDDAAGLTRAVSFTRDFIPDRFLHPVSAPVVEALRTMLRLKPLETIVPPKDVAAAGDSAHTLLGAKLRAHIHEQGAVTQEEGWYRVLTNDAAAPEVWDVAIRGITTPAKGGAGERLQGEALRAKTSPTVTELLRKRVGAWRIQPGADQMGLTRHLEMIRRIGTWQQGAESTLLGATVIACTEAWAHDAAQAPRKPGIAAILGRGIARITLDRVASGETNALVDYATWLRRVTDEDYRQWQESRQTRQHPLEPLWQHPEHPAVAEISAFLFDPTRSGLRDSLAPAAGVNGLTVIESGTLLTRLPAFRALLVKALEDRTPAGSVRIIGNGRFEVRDSAGRITAYRRPSDSRLLDAKDAQVIRYCDIVAPGLGNWDSIPRLELFWTLEERDAAIATCLAALKDDSSKFNRRGFHGETFEVRQR